MGTQMSLPSAAEMNTLALYKDQPSLDIIRTRGVRDQLEGPYNVEDQYSQSMIQVDPMILRVLRVAFTRTGCTTLYAPGT